MHVGLIGARGFGQHHLQAMQDSPWVQAVTLAGRERLPLEDLRSRFSKVRAITDNVSQLLEDPGIDLLDIVLPHDLHLPVALAALERGKHLLLEKPPARTIEEFDRMVEAAAAADRRLFVVANLLFGPVHHAIRRAVDAGMIGRPFLSLEVSVGNALHVYQDPANWRADLERCGGGLQIDGGFHAVYRHLFYLESLGAPGWITADRGQIGVDAPTKGEDFCALTMGYSASARIHLMSQWTARSSLGPLPSGIVGTEGTLLFGRDDATPPVLRRPGREDEPLPVEPGPRGFAETATACVGHYLDCLATGAAPWVDLDLARLTLEIITSAYWSGDEGRRIPLTGQFRTRFPRGSDWVIGLLGDWVGNRIIPPPAPGARPNGGSCAAS